ncbi:pre-mRNA cleavage complex 2 protein Pcf11-like [Cryptotermes secundus]|uniref:pre-mRNA cleavage complex 2 protein Pcf11-like n=1 Tax=Cryptotermes secundus TaxID=105785 RepID=UPI000CD7C84B|nr:pre-mRNA cleavage complex 2 protein Pcf11-like [Cryptotermes secundus]
MKYRQHLDWHFRQNRRDKDNTRKAQSREWYYAASDWIQFEETEDFEEGAKSWFETQQAVEAEEKEIQKVPSVCAGENPEDAFCALCHDKSEQFYNDEREEWHLHSALMVDGKTYHPLCYDDYNVSIFINNITLTLKTLFYCL